jgi:NSS family neurotransmitter:Na+ symporter
LLIAIYVGWFWNGSEEKEELLAGGRGWVYPVWHFLIRYVSPLAVAVILYFKVKETGLFIYIASLL